MNFVKLSRLDGSSVLVAPTWVVDIVPPTLNDIPSTKMYRSSEEVDLARHAVVWLSGGRHHVVQGSLEEVAAMLVVGD